MFFSASMCAFYPNELKADYDLSGSWPADAVEITDAEASEYCGVRIPEGKKLGVYEGRPCWIDIPIDMELLARNARLMRDQILADKYDKGISIALRALRMTSDPDQIEIVNGKISALDAYAVLLLGIPQQPGFPTTINWPEAPTL